MAPPASGHALSYKVPPYAVSAEKIVIGSILADPPLLAEVEPILPDAQVFFRPEHGRLYQAIRDVCAGRDISDTDTLVKAMAEAGHLDAEGGEATVRALTGSSGGRTSALENAQVVREKALMRALIDKITEILHDAYHATDGFDAILTRAKRHLTALRPPKPRKKKGVAVD